MKFWINNNDFIYLFQLMKAAGIEQDYETIGKIINEGRVMVNDQTVFQQRLKLQNKDEIRYLDYHIKVHERDEDGGIPAEFNQNAKTIGNVRHGKVQNWKSQPVKLEMKIDDEIAQLSRKLHQKLSAENKTISCAESCTGGLLQKIISEQSGASKYFLGGIVCYSDFAKQKILKVKYSTLSSFGAVSDKVAIELVQNTQQLFESDYAISITGIAGPTGGTKEKPVGTVFIGVSHNQKVRVKKLFFDGNRDNVRKKTCLNALKFLLGR